MKSNFKNIIYFSIGIVLSILLLEAILIKADKNEYDIFQNDESSGLLTYKPNIEFPVSESCFSNIVKTNNLGFHGRDVNVIKPKNKYRILVVGGSFVESKQLPTEKSFTSILENKLNLGGDKYEVIPISFSGNKTFHNILYYLRFGEELNPDMVISLITEYEPSGEIIYKDSAGKILLELPKTDQNPKVIQIKNLMRKSKLLMNLYHKADVVINNIGKTKQTLLLRHPNENKTEGEENQTINKEQWEKEKELLDLFNKKVKEKNIPFILLSWTTPNTSTTTKNDMFNNLNQISRESGFPYIELDKKIKKKADENGKSLVWQCDNHWSEYGHKYTSEVLYDYIKNKYKL